MIFKNIDKIFFITLVDNKERINNVLNIINELNNSSNNIIINYTTRLNFTNELKTLFDKFSYHDSFINLRYFCGFFKHFEIISEAYFLNYNNILICEDDINFEDINYFKESLKNIPSDADFIQFVNLDYWETNKYNVIIDNSNIFFNKIKNLKTFSTMCYFLSNKMIKYLYNYFYERGWDFSDSYQYKENLPNKNDINIYMLKRNIINPNKLNSTIINKN